MFTIKYVLITGIVIYKSNKINNTISYDNDYIHSLINI